MFYRKGWNDREREEEIFFTFFWMKINKVIFKMELMDYWKFVLLLNSWWKFELNVSIPKNKLNFFFIDG